MRTALDHAHAGRLLSRAWPRVSVELNRLPAVHVLAIGKAAPAMATACVPLIGRRMTSGLAIGTHLDVALPAPLEWMESAHPVPDERSVSAGRAALARAAAVDPDEGLVVLLSGGASALMALPAGRLTLADKQAVTRQLLHAGADIHAINCVRKHLSRVKGGRLAASCAGVTLALAISDVVGDDPSVIGSGPCVGDPTTFADALAVVGRCGGREAFPPVATAHLEDGVRGLHPETPKPGDAALARSATRVIGSAVDVVGAACNAAERLGYAVIVLEGPVTGEARVRGPAHIRDVRALAEARSPRPVCVVSSGETTVRVTGRGRGGRNQEFALAALSELAAFGRPVCLASVGTDGVDGPTDAAGALADSATLARAAARGLDPMRYLEANDAWSFFETLGDLVRTGRTSTNVGDLQVALVGAPAVA